MVRLFNIPDIGIYERMAVNHLKMGTADYENSYKVLADCHGVLTLGLRHKRDNTLDGVLRLGAVALLNMYDRYKQARRWGATGDELHALIAMLDCNEDFWRRQSSALMDRCINELAFIRQKQYAEKAA